MMCQESWNWSWNLGLRALLCSPVQSGWVAHQCQSYLLAQAALEKALFTHSEALTPLPGQPSFTRGQELEKEVQGVR